jgi:microcin C transport system permease protein
MKGKYLLPLDPLTRIRVERFKSIKRGYWSLIAMAFFLALSLLAELFINSRAIAVWQGGRLRFPTYAPVIPGRIFGLDYEYETDYRELAAKLGGKEPGWVILPLVPYDAFEQDFRDGSYPPYPPSLSTRHYLGTDAIGRDIVARLAYGFRIAIFFSLLYVLATFLIGVLLGCLMGYWGGAFDIILQRIIEIFEQIPFLYVVMIVVSIFKPNFILFLAIYVVFSWTARTHDVRAMTYRERERDYVIAARSMGASTWRIITYHIIPNILVVIVTMIPFAIAAGISSLTVLDYLGFGLPPPTPSWGELLGQGVSQLAKAPWILWSVISAMVGVLVMIAFVGEGLRDAFDPRKFTVYK